MFQVLFSLTAVLVAVAMDISTGKVSNRWICVLWCVGMLVEMQQGFWGLWYFLKGSILPILVLFPLFRFRMLGPGDIKLFSALGGVMGVVGVLNCIVLSFLMGGILSLGILLYYGKLLSRLRYFAEYIQKSIKKGQVIPYYSAGDGWGNIHFTVPILMSVILYAGGIY